MTAERLRRLDDEALGTALADLELRWPAAPRVAADVLETIRATDRVRSLAAGRVGVVGRRRTVLLIAAATALLVLVAFAARLVIDIGAITIERIEERPTAPGAPDQVFPGGAADAQATLEDARASLGGEPAFPTALGGPDRLWVQAADPSGTSSTFAWVGAAWAPTEERPAIPGTPWGAVFLQLRGDVELITKQIGIAGDLREIDVDGAPGVWLEGPHDLLLDDGGTPVRYEVNGNVLVWAEGDRTYRLETSLALDQALAIAATVG